MENLVLRNTPKIAGAFVFETCENNNGLDCYEIFARDKDIVIKGNNNIAKAMGYYRYLQEYCNVLLTNGDFDISYIKKAPLPAEKITYTVPQKIRMAMTYERFAGEAGAWGFDRWEKEIDFMAMIGVNTPLAITGSDGVLYKMLIEFRIKQEDALAFISGSSFWSRQLTGNLFGYLPLNSAEYFDRKIEIGRRVTQREKELDMSPVHQGYISTVPFSFRKKYTKADLIKLPVWNRFPPSMTLSSADDIYIDIFNKTFLKKQQELLGEVHNYIFDPLVDVDFKGYTSHVEKICEKFSSLLKDFDSSAVWFMHSSSAKSYDKKIDNLIVIDETASDYKNHNGFGGNNFIVGLKGNLYGRTVICGDMNAAAKNPYKNASAAYQNALGTGLFFDSDLENPLFYSLAAEALTAGDSIDIASFIEKYSINCYATKDYANDLMQLQKLCYGEGSALNQASALCARPCSEINHTAPFDTFERPYDNKDLLELLKKSLACKSIKNEVYRKDAQSIMRQILSNLLRPLYLQATASFFARKVVEFEKTSNAFMDIIQDIDRLLKTIEATNIYSRIELARQLGDTKELRQNLEINFLIFHTIWGPLKNSEIYDISWREWGGMTADFYAKRWYIYFRMLASYFSNPKKLKDMSKRKIYDRNQYAETLLSKRLEYMENDWIMNYIPRPKGIEEEDTIDVIEELIEKYEAIVKDPSKALDF